MFRAWRERKQHPNVTLPTTDIAPWNPGDVIQSLENLRKAVETEANTAAGWYWREKGPKSLWSRLIRTFALTLSAAAGLTPMIIQIVKNSEAQPSTFDSGPIAAFLVGTAAGLLGLDKAFGFTASWTRYVVAATAITKEHSEFRVDWVALWARVVGAPTTDQQAEMVKRAGALVAAVQAVLVQETSAWAKDFQDNLTQLDKDLKAKLETLKTDQDKAATAGQPGALEVAVSNADKTDNFQFNVSIQGSDGSPESELIAHSLTWTKVGIAPGLYQLTLDSLFTGQPRKVSKAVEVKAGQTTSITVQLPV